MLLNQSINQVYIQQKRTELTEWLTELPNLELTEYARENNAGRLEKTDCTLVCYNSCTLICTVCVSACLLTLSACLLNLSSYIYFFSFVYNYNVVVRLWMQHVVDA
jgi:hypothetical protein